MKAQISLKWSEDQLISRRSTDVRIKLPTDNQEELSTDAERSTDKLNTKYHLMLTVQYKSTQTVASALVGVTSTLEAKSEQVDLGILKEWSRQTRKIWRY